MKSAVFIKMNRVLFFNVLITVLQSTLASQWKTAQRQKIRGTPMETHYPTKNEIEDILSEVNMLRNNIEQNSPNMRCVSYSNVLASEAYASAKKCDGYRETPSYKIDGFERVAQSVLVMRQGTKPNYQTILNAWYLQYADFDHASGKCAPEEEQGFCQDYLNLMYADTDQIGCAMARCDDIESAGGITAYVVVCFYGNGYNPAKYGGKPFPFGEAASCSSCPSEKPMCSDSYKRLCCDAKPTEPTTLVTSTSTSTTSIPTTSAEPTTTTSTVLITSSTSLASTTSTSTATELTTSTSTTSEPTASTALSTSVSTSSTAATTSSTVSSATTPTATVTSTVPTTAAKTTTASGNINCTDDPDFSCTQRACHQQPGIYLTKCRRTCGNCKGDQCFDSSHFNCAYYKRNGLCERERSAMTRFCPKTCKLCDVLTGRRALG